MGYEVFPAPSSSVDLGKYSIARVSGVTTPPTAGSLQPNLIYFTTNFNAPTASYIINATGVAEDQNRQFVIRSGTTDLVTTTPSQTVNVVVTLVTAGTSWGFKMQSTWLNQSLGGVFRYGTNNTLNDVKGFDTGIIIAMGGNGNGINDEPIKVSTNGQSFTRYLPANLSTNYWFGRFSYYSTAGYFAAIQGDALYQSTNLSNWNRVSTAEPFWSYTPQDGYWDSVTNRHYMVGNWGNTLYTSTNGANWSTSALTGGGLSGIFRFKIGRFGNYLMTLGRLDNNVPLIEISTNGTSWTKAVIPEDAATWSTNFNPTVRAVAYNGSRYVAAVNGSGMGVLIQSTDGLNWTTSLSKTPSTDGNFGGIIWDGTYFIAAGSLGSASTTGWRWSTNATTWGSMSTSGSAAGRTDLTGTAVTYMHYNTNHAYPYMAFVVTNNQPGNALISTAVRMISTVSWGIPLNGNTANWIIEQFPASLVVGV